MLGWSEINGIAADGIESDGIESDGIEWDGIELSRIAISIFRSMSSTSFELRHRELNLLITELNFRHLIRYQVRKLVWIIVRPQLPGQQFILRIGFRVK